MSEVYTHEEKQRRWLLRLKGEVSELAALKGVQICESVGACTNDGARSLRDYTQVEDGVCLWRVTSSPPGT